ncbi:YfiR family protein [Reinekea marinisedimentorum]|uniref:Uncharacterized protein DUF4154 n=1 Tax=Reinekea marinisedimentorum TaxID=230495 RepID=A0A4R3I005_9GAMM|nr:YfiR family protein [Reinekea marinisedimentorum]TCS37119.1 uncharacterized protein DUF4154 [Reinekea marinisedimentorum]
MKRFAITVKAVTLILLVFMSAQLVAQDQLRDYELKAVLIYKLAKFVTWPEDSGTTFNICVYGQNPFGEALDKLTGELVNNQPITIRYRSRITTDLNDCNVLFIATSANGHLNRILLATSYSPVLTISDIQNFASFGGMIELTNANQQIGFRINVKAAKAVELNIASPLLELATIVGGR